MNCNKRKTNKYHDIILKAVKAVIEDGKSYREASKMYNIPKASLQRYCKQCRPLEDQEKQSTSTQEKCCIDIYRGSSVFTEKEELKFKKYLLLCCDIYFGLTLNEVRNLAYQYADFNKVTVPPSWMKDMIAGKDWCRRFLKRHEILNIRKSQVPLLEKATSLNKKSVELFFNSLTKVMTCYKFEPCNIWNMDEMGIFAAQKQYIVMGRREAYEYIFFPSTNIEQLITFALTISATGNSIPPYFVLPIAHFEERLLRDGPVGCTGGANPSGWINEENFISYLNYFAQSVRASKDNPVLLLLDNHDTHLSIKALDYAKNNGIIILSFPPYCSHKLQPLNISVNEPFKGFLISTLDSWMLRNPGKRLMMRDILSIIKDNLPLVVTFSNIKEGFKKSGIYPFNPNTFTDVDFIPWCTTNKQQKDKAGIVATSTKCNEDLSQPSTSTQLPLVTEDPPLNQ